MSDTKVKNDASAKPEKAKNKSKGKSIGWIVGVVVLILISISFVLPQTMFYDSSSAISFGKYDDKSIEMTYDSYFYYLLQQYYAYYAQYYGEEAAASYSYNIYYSAYQSAMIHEAIKEEAAKAGVVISDAAIAEQAVNAGFYSDGENTFSKEVFSATDSSQRKIYNKWIKEFLTENAVLADYSAAKMSQGEGSFIYTLNENARTIEYITVDSSLYPDEDALLYLEANKELFQTASYTVATFATEEEATAAIEALGKGTKTMDEVVSESIGTYKGYSEMTRAAFASANGEDTAANLFSSTPSTLVGPAKTAEGYAIYRVEAEVKDADGKDEAVLETVKAYIASNDTEVMKAALEKKAAELYASASSDFDKTADENELDIHSVTDVAENPGNSQLIASFNYMDYEGYIATAIAEDAALYEKLFSAEFGTVLAPFYANGAYIIARPVEAEGESYYASLFSSLYPSYASSFSSQDYQNAIFASDKVKDDFFNGYLSMLVGSSN